MDIPSIKFRYFEKLKLWHDYLSPDSVFETQKKSFWDHEKMILLWAFTDLHRHLLSGLNNKRLFQIYDLQKTNKRDNKYIDYNGDFYKLKSKVIPLYKLKIDELRNEIMNYTGKMNHIKGNLVVKDFAKAIYDEGVKRDEDDGENKKNKYPDSIRINPRGMLLGEILYENYCKPNIFRKNYRKYRGGFCLLVFLIIATGLVFISIFFKSVLFPIFDYIKLMNFIDIVCKISQ